MMQYFYYLLLFVLPQYAYTQQKQDGITQLDSLHALTTSHTASEHFAKLYYAKTMSSYLEDSQPDSTLQFIHTIQASFFSSFLKAHNCYITNQYNNIPQHWKAYYSDTSLNELQAYFIGANAHINGDLRAAITENFGYDSIKKYAHVLLELQPEYNHFFDSLYNIGYNYKKVKWIHRLSLGLDRYAAHYTIASWRKKQLQLALLWYSDPEKYTTKWKRLQVKMKRWDKFAVNWLK